MKLNTVILRHQALRSIPLFPCRDALIEGGILRLHPGWQHLVSDTCQNVIRHLWKGNGCQNCMAFPCNMTLDLESSGHSHTGWPLGAMGTVPSFAGDGEKKTERWPLRRKCHSVLSLVNDYEHKRAALKELKLQDSAGVLIPCRGRELLFFFFNICFT